RVRDEEPARPRPGPGRRDAFTLFFAEGRAEAPSAVAWEQPAVVSLDLGLPPHPESVEYGLETLDQIMRTAPATKVVVLGDNGGRDSPGPSGPLGAIDSTHKPVPPPPTTTPPPPPPPPLPPTPPAP